MTTALALWGYALILGTAGTAVMRRATWVDRAPRLAIAAWYSLSASSLLAVAVGGLALVVPTHVVSTNLADLLESCAMALRARYATPGGVAMATSGVAVATMVVGRWSYCSLAELSRAAAARRRHVDILAMVGRLERGVTLLDDDRPYVYCVAGRRHRIVMTTGASDLLDPEQLSAVLAHERAHLRGRHHLVIGAATATARAFPWIPLFTAARDEVTRLVELAADDAASSAAARLSLAEAMLALSATTPPAGALAAGGSAAGARVRRLITGHRPLAAGAGALGLAAAVAVIVTPLIALATPAMMASPDCCSVDRQRIVAAAHCAATTRAC